MHSKVMAFALTLMVTACGGEPEIPTLMVNDQCQFDGPGIVEEGTLRFTLQRTGLGDYGGAVVRFEADMGTADLATHFETTSRDWSDRPDWIVVSALLETRDEDITPDDNRGETTLISLQPGEHAVVCIDLSNGRSDVVERVTVVSADS